ncbi:MAG: helix-turn-helix domain-containing protein [bacterium]
MPDEILTIKEAAAYMKVSVVTLRRYLLARKISFLKLDSKILLRKADINKFLDFRRIESFQEHQEKYIN